MSPIPEKNSTASANKDENELDVVIIGAGWAGLATAKELQAQKKTFQVLEGRDTYGGRCRSQVMNDGVSVVEYGAQWIHGAKKTNPVYQFALANGFDLKRSAYEAQTVYETLPDGSCLEISKQKYKQMYDSLMEGKQGFYAYQEYRQEEDDYDVSLKECAQDYLNKINATQEQTRWMWYLLDMEVSQEYSGALEDISMYWWDSDEDIPGGDVEIGQVGYKGLLAKFMEGMEHLMEYHAKVTQIEWSEKDRVVVHYTQNGQAHQVAAKKVVVTVPIGVLQAKTIQFQPALPAPKQRSIDNIGMGLMNKCLFLWNEGDIDKLPWPQDTEWMERIAPTGGQQGLWTEYFYGRQVTGRPTLCAFTAGSVARQVEQWSEEEIQASAMEALQKQFAGQTIPPPRQVIVTKWGQDEFSLGAYSFNKFGGKHSDRKKLAEPIDQKVYFAGEACHSQYFGTTHGALMSGISAAKQIQKHSGKASMASKAKKVFQGKNKISATTTVVAA